MRTEPPRNFRRGLVSHDFQLSLPANSRLLQSKICEDVWILLLHRQQVMAGVAIVGNGLSVPAANLLDEGRHASREILHSGTKRTGAGALRAKLFRDSPTKITFSGSGCTRPGLSPVQASTS
jgi:hypothetical protein